jgi:hypothetical protein
MKSPWVPHASGAVDRNSSTPPPNIRSGPVTCTYWRAISCSQLRFATCAPKEAGVAWVMVEVATRPVAFPCFRASSRMLGFTGRPSPWKQISRFSNFSPQAQAEAAGAESVTVLLAE